RMIPDEFSTTGFLIGPGGTDLKRVADAGRQLGNAYRIMATLLPSPAAVEVLGIGIGVSVGTGGRFDYQREGNLVTGFKQHPEYRGVSDVNVGLFMQQVGFTLGDTLRISGTFASLFSRNASPSAPYHLDPKTRTFIEVGYE